ncbi:TonB-dependent siderophore receptor [Gynuella sp.]|uniref:TonB-dependent siderophore receptor n=1 Tax=Gynuella sp. TaxID=2969146 RepID=UPI003D0B8307
MKYPPLVLSGILFSLPVHAEELPDLQNADDKPAGSVTALTLDTLTVRGRAESLYRETDATLATRTTTSIDQTPQAIQVLPETLIEDQAARQITDLYRSISGVSQYSYSGVTFRGFRQDEILYDGMRGDPFNGFAIPQLFSIEQVQVLKGASGALYGAGEPGGVINYVTKKPTYNSQHHLTLTTGNYGYLAGSVESSGPITQTGNQRYRIGWYSDEEEPFRNNTEQHNRIIDLGYALDPGTDTTITLQYNDIHQRYDGARLRGIPIDDGGNFLTDINWNANEASDYQKLKARVFQTRADHLFNDWLSANMTMRYYQNTETQKYHEPNGLADGNGDGVVDFSKRQYRDQVRHNEGTSLALNAIAELGTHTLLAGTDYFHLDSDFIYQRANVDGISLNDPQYGVTPVEDYSLKQAKDEESETDRIGLYLQDQWRLSSAWDVLAGVRVDHYKDRVVNHMTDVSESYDNTGYSYRLGSAYQLNSHIHPYAVYATGFVPQDAADQLESVGGPFDPEESQQFEIGVRTYWLENAVNLNVAVYDITRKNILQQDPQNDDRLVAYGAVRSQGIETDLMADLTERWVMNLSYAYNNTNVEKAYDGIRDVTDGEFANSPHHQLGVWTRYDIPAWHSAISFGADYVSQQISRDGQTIQPYTIFDASWQTRWRDWLFQLNVKNLFDKEYASSGFIERTGAFPGEPRRMYLTARYHF